MICLLCGDIVTLIEFASFLVWMFYGISMAALLVMRYTKRDVKRPFKVNTSLYCRSNDIYAYIASMVVPNVSSKCPTMGLIGYYMYTFIGEKLYNINTMEK